MKLLDSLRDDAVALADSELPSQAELRPIVGALVKRLEHIATTEGAQLLDSLDLTPATSPVGLQPSAPAARAPVAVTPVQVGPTSEPVAPARGGTEGTDLIAKAAEIDALKARLAELEA